MQERRTRKIKSKRRRGDEVLPEDIDAPVVIERWPRKRQIRLSADMGAAEAIGKLSPGCEIFGLTKGQFSLQDILAAILDQTGPADVDLATFTMAELSILFLRGLIDAEKIRRIRVIIDRSFQGREPEYCATLLAAIGNDKVRTTRNHAKYLVIQNETWKIVVRSSMNFGADPKLEFFEVSDDPELCDFLTRVGDDLFARPAAFNFSGDGAGLDFASARLESFQAVASEDPRLIPSRVAEMLGISKAMVTKLRNAGIITFDADGAAPTSRIKVEYEKYLEVKRPKSDTAEFHGTVKTSEFYANRARKEAADAEMAELALARERGSVVDAAAAGRAWFNAGRRVRDLLLGMAVQIPADLLSAARADNDDARVVRDMTTILDRAIRAALISLDKKP